MPLPFKFKIGVSGCPNNCSESCIKDLGLVGSAKGWRVLAGGFGSGLKPRLADLIATDLTDAEVLDLAQRMLEWYKDKNQKKRLGRIIDDIGLDTFKAELGLSAE
jgi:NAD(P)H-nitrite reductase large subunit